MRWRSLRRLDKSNSTTLRRRHMPKPTGSILAEALGIDAAVLQEIPNADGTDQAEARAMNAALWPATLGYWMDTQMSPVFDAEAIERTRRHFMDRVSGRGICRRSASASSRTASCRP